MKLHTCVRDAEVKTMYTSFRSIHPPTLGTITIVEKLCRQTSQLSALFCLKHKVGNSRSVLSEVNDQSLTGTDNHRFARFELLHNVDLAVLIIGRACSSIPRISPNGRECKVPATIYLGTIGGKNLSFKLLIDFRLR